MKPVEFIPDRSTFAGRIDASPLKLVFNVDEAGAFRQTPRSASRCVGSGDKAVPAPYVAFERHQTLTGL